MNYDYLDTPIGRLLLIGDDHGLCHIDFERSRYPTAIDPAWPRDAAAFTAARTQLLAWFAGERRDFDLVLNPRGTAFQRRVWQELRAIPYATTISYGELARRIGNTSASRAVGAANGRNPLPIIVPCHRVIGNDGSLTGFGGGIDTKRWLLEHERRHAPMPEFALAP